MLCPKHDDMIFAFLSNMIASIINTTSIADIISITNTPHRYDKKRGKSGLTQKILKQFETS